MKTKDRHKDSPTSPLLWVEWIKGLEAKIYGER